MPTSDDAVVYRLSAAGGRFRWLLDRVEVAHASWRDQWWDLYGPAGGRALLSLVGASVEGRTRVALVDHTARRAATFATAEPMSRSHIGVVRDSYDEPLVIVRAEGPSGLHLVDPSGGLLALSTRRRAGEGAGSDVLITRAGSLLGTELLFGVGLALELLRVGRLGRVA
ncbi:MAG TPA: hypothetical protein VFJ85_05370 [Acidimicrobiales bacterium]|nr:hypothetical protein [Acidimicrobiales bacterium]